MLFFENNLKDEYLKNLLIKNIHDSVERNFFDISEKLLIYIKRENKVCKIYYEEPNRFPDDNSLSKIQKYEYSDRVVLGINYNLELEEFYDIVITFISILIYDYETNYTDRNINIDKYARVNQITNTLKEDISTNKIFYVDFKQRNIVMNDLIEETVGNEYE